MKRIIVTSSHNFVDIDSLASAIAYGELLKKEGKRSQAVLVGPLNQSITNKIKSWKLEFLKEAKINDEDFVIVDVSEPKDIAPFVKQKRIIEVFDHRAGFEKYWEKRLGEKAKIEPVGACATLIWEEYKRREKAAEVSPLSANLMYTAIASNTLNFKASVTSKRDKKAFVELKKFIDLPKNWIEKYFQEIEVFAYQNPRAAIINDIKPREARRLAIGQLELWNSKKFIKKHLAEVKKVLTSYNKKRWFFTSPSISEGRNYLYAESEAVKKLLGRALGVRFKDNLATTKKLWLRKEILKKIQEL